MNEGNRGKRESGFFLKRGSSNAALRVGLTRIDALDRRLAHEVEAATAIDQEIGFVLVCLRLQLLSSATELCLAINSDPYAVDLAQVTDLITSYKMAISDAADAIEKAKARAGRASHVAFPAVREEPAHASHLRRVRVPRVA